MIEQRYSAFRLNETISLPSILTRPLPSIFNASLPTFFKNTKSPVAASSNKSNDTNAFNEEFDRIHRVRDDELNEAIELIDDEYEYEYKNEDSVGVAGTEETEKTEGTEDHVDFIEEQVTMDTEPGIIINSRYYIDDYVDDGHTGIIRRGNHGIIQHKILREI